MTVAVEFGYLFDMFPADDHPPIGPVSDKHLPEALRLVFSHLSPDDGKVHEEAIMAEIAAAEISAAGLIGAVREGRLVGAVLSQIQPGRTALVWPPRLVPAEPPTTATGLLEAACHFLGTQGVCMVQALTAGERKADKQLLQAGGFEPLAELLYLVSFREDFPDKLPGTQLLFEPYTSARHDRLTHVLEATYEQTLDCPELNGVRQIEDVLVGYRSTGAFSPDYWLIVRYAGEDVGCLLVADHPRHDNVELVYMGVISSLRGRGWGIEITRHAQWLTRQAGRRRLVLAVDAANAPAVRMYADAGFQTWDRRSVYLRRFPGG